MSISAKFSGFASCSLLSLLTCAVLAGFHGSAEAQAAPQLLPYTVTAVAGGGTYGTTYSTTAVPYTANNYCGTNTTTAPSGTPPLPLTAWPKALDTAGDGCLATQVLLSVPRAAAADSEGNLYIIDSNNQSIRRVDAHTGIITTVAGSIAGTPVYPAKGAACATGSSLTATDVIGGGCLATQIIQAYPYGIAVDKQGNVWFSDYTLGAVRKVEMSTGILRTIVNTSGTSGYNADNVAYTKTGITAAAGKLYRPYGIAFDKAGNLYIADNYNNVVDVVNQTGASATIAGATVPAGDIYTIAGLGCPYTTTPGCSGSAYYGSSNGSGVPTASSLRAPYQVAVDSSNNIYVADEFPQDVRMITAAGVISTVVGINGSYSATLPNYVSALSAVESVYGIAVDPLGNLYVDVYYGTTVAYVARVDIASGKMYVVAGQVLPGTACTAKTDTAGDGCPATKALLSKPQQPFVDAAGNLYITDQGNNLVRKVSVGTQFTATAPGTPIIQNLDIHFGVGDTMAASGAFALSTSIKDFSLGVYSCTTNADTTQDCVLPVAFNPTTAGFRTAPLVVTSTSGKVSTFALTGTGLASVLAVDPGTPSTLVSTGITAVNDIALDNAGNLYAAVPSATSILKYNSAGVSQTSVGSGLSKASAVAVDGAGNVYAALTSGSVIEVPSNGGSQITLASGFTYPAGIAVDAYGNVYVSDQKGNTVSEILAGTSTLTSTGALVPLASGLSSPTGLAVDSYGNVYVSNASANTVVEIPFNSGSVVTVLAGTFGLSSPMGLALDAAGSLYAADSGNNRIVYIPNESTGLNSVDKQIIVTGLGTPTGVAVAANGNVFVSDGSVNAINGYNRSAAIINFPAQVIAQQGVSATTGYASADIVNVGNQAATFNSPIYTATGNTADFTLTPTTLPSSGFPAAGYGLSLSTSFTPATAASFTAMYTFANTMPSAQPKLTLNGTGTNPAGTLTMSLGTTVPNGQSSWIYGQTAVIAVTLTPANSAWAAVPSGTISLLVDGSVSANTTLLSTTSNGNIVTITLNLTKLVAGPHSISASITSDAFYASASTTASLSLPIAKAALVVQGGTFSVPFDVAIPTLTSTLVGLQNSDNFNVLGITTASTGSPVAAYTIVPSVPVSLSANYSITVQNGTLNITQDSTVTTVGTSAASVNSTTQVTLTATVANTTPNTVVVSAPTGTVTFYNTVGTTTTKIGTSTLNSSGVATYTAKFAVVGATTNNSVTAVYGGDTNFITSTSAGLPIVSGVPTFGATPTTNSSLTVTPGQSGLMYFTLLPAYGYDGTITFSCAAPSTTVSCIFSPSSITENGTTTSNLVAVTINSQATASSNDSNRSALPLTLAVLPGLGLLFGFAGMRRKFLRGYLALCFVALCLIGFSGCTSSKIVAGTPSGAQTVTITASGTGGSFASVTQQFTVTLNVQ